MEVPISERAHYKRLEEKGIVIEDIFLKEQNGKKEYLVRSTDGLRMDSVVNRPRVEKRYFLGKDCIFCEKDYDSKMKYTFITGKNQEDEVVCSNCGHRAKKKEFWNGCPYCGTIFNFDYSSKSHRVEHFQVTNLIDPQKIKTVIISMVILFVVVSKMMNSDLVSWIIQVICTIPFVALFSYVLVCLVAGILWIKKMYVNGSKITEELESLEKRGIKIGRVYNDLYSGLLAFYYDEKKAPNDRDLIDFDITSYQDLEVIEKDGKMYLSMKYQMRKIYLEGKKIRKQEERSQVILKRNSIIELLKEGYQVISCVNCGASIDITKEECEYCHTPNDFKKEWTIEKKETEKVS